MNLEGLKYKVVDLEGNNHYLLLSQLMDFPKEKVKSIHYLVATVKNEEINEEVYSNDTIHLDIREFAEDNPFFGSNAGQEMKALGAEILEVEYFEVDNEIEKTASLNIIIRFLRNGHYIREEEYNNQGLNEEDEGYEIFSPNNKVELKSLRDSDLFTRYLLLKGAKVISK